MTISPSIRITLLFVMIVQVSLSIHLGYSIQCRVEHKAFCISVVSIDSPYEMVDWEPEKINHDLIPLYASPLNTTILLLDASDDRDDLFLELFTPPPEESPFLPAVSPA